MPTATLAAQLVSPESHLASGRSSEKLSLPSLQSKMKCDPEGYEMELNLLYRHFDSSLHLFQQQSALSVSADPVVSKDLGDMSMFLAHVTPCYPEQLANFPGKLIDLLSESGRSLLPSLRSHLTQALILLVNRKIVGLEETLKVFMELQTLGDRNLRKLAFSSVVQIIRRMNQKHINEAKNRKLQSVIFSMLQEEDELKAKRALVVLCDLHRRKLWFDDRTANAICTACFHSSSKVLISTLSFLLGYEEVVEDNDSDGSSNEDETPTTQPLVVLRREDVYKANQKGTTSSKKKKKAKLQRVMRSMKRQQRRASGNCSWGSYTPLTHLKDPQGFAEKLFSRLQKCNERFEVRMMMLKVIARTVGLHRLILLNFYPFLQRYAQPHQRDVTSLLAAGVQACHDMVPPDAVEPLFKQVVNQFVHDRSRPEAIAVGLNVVREICMRMPLLMTEDLLQDLVLYKKSHEKAVSTAARSLITLFRELCPSFLVKKDRGRPTDPKAKPKEFGEVTVVGSVPGLELLEHDHELVSGDGVSEVDEDSGDEEDGELEGTREELDVDEGDDSENDDNNSDDVNYEDEDDDNDDDKEELVSTSSNCSDDDSGDEAEKGGDEINVEESKGLKRKFSNYESRLHSVDQSLRALKRMAYSKPTPSLDLQDGILSNEDFNRIKELKEKHQARLALTQQGLLKDNPDFKSSTFKIPSSESLSMKRVDPAKLEINIRRRMSKEERLALVKAGREDRGKYLARAAVKQKKTGGLSNRQKEHKKAMPLAAKKAKVARSRQEKKKMQRRAGKQFRGKKAWK